MTEVSTRIDSISSRTSINNNKQRTNPVSYGSFTPYCVIDSEYLKSLIGGKDNSCELVESASLQPVPGAYFPSSLGSQSPTEDGGSSPESGVYSPRGASLHSSLRTYSSAFFSECDIQLSKLFAFMEFHLSKVEAQVNLVRRVESKGSIHNPSHHTIESDDISDDSGVCETESKTLLQTLQSDREEGALSILSRLREVLVSIQESLSSSFNALHSLIDMHDHHHANKKGASFLEKKTPRRNELEKKMESCLENLDYEMNKLHRKQDLKIDGLGHVRGRSESEITVNVRQSSTSCITYFHAALFVIILGLIAYMYEYDYSDDKWTVYLRLLRGPFLVLLFLYFYATNMKVWALKHIDYVRIFNHHPRATPTPNYVYKVAGCFCVFFTLLVIILLISSPFTNEVPGKIVPLIMWLSFIVFLVNPLNIFKRKGRVSLLLVFVRILLAPFTFVYFGDFWLADQLNSTVALLLDLQYMTCYMIADTWYGNVDTSVCTSSGNGIRPVLSCLPALWRLLQCLRCFYDTWEKKHLLNALKYFTTFPVVVFATMFATKVTPGFVIWKLNFTEVGWILILWLISAFVHAVYTFIWDIYCDWGLWNFSKGTFFRPNLVYRYKIIYFGAMCLDLILRFAWALKVSLAIVWHLDSDLIYTGEWMCLLLNHHPKHVHVNI